jgi:TRAP-type C4-dicarboxylate transport system permease small subunit
MWVYIFSCLCGIVYFAGMTYQTFLDAVHATAQQETVMSNYLFYVWPSRWALPLGMGCITLALLVNIGRAFKTNKPLEALNEETE